MKIEITPGAEQDLLAGYTFYERQRGMLGNYFLDTLFADIDSLLIYAGIHQVFFGSFHRALSKRFPCAIYYKVLGETIRVYAVLDCRQDPSAIPDRLRSVK